MRLGDLFGGFMVTDAEVRAEIWRLGVRSLGEPLQSALQELATPGVTAERSGLLRACVRKMRSDA